MILLVILSFIVIYFRFFRENFDVKFKYKDIKDQVNYNISDNTPCIYTEIAPQVAKVYNNDFVNIYKSTSETNIESDYLKPYYTNISFGVDIPIAQESYNSVLPNSNTYSYCEHKNNIPSCTVLSCGISKEQHNYKVAELLENSKKIPQEKAIIELSQERKNNSEDYTTKINSLQDYVYF